MLPCKKRKFMEPSDAESNPKVPHTEEITTLDREHMHTQNIKPSPERTVQGEIKSDENLARTALQKKAHGLNCQERPQDSTDSGNSGGTSTTTYDGILKTSGGLTEISARIAEEKKLESDCGKGRHEYPSHTIEAETPAQCSSEEKNSKMINPVCASTGSVKAPSSSTIKSPKKFVPVRRSLQLGEIPSSSGEAKHTVECPTDEDDMEFSEMVITLEEDEADSGSDKRKKKRKRPLAKRKRESIGEDSATVPSDIELDNVLEHALEDRAKLHNLTATNVRNILHEVITNEHVVAMMKAAINETEEVPAFEPKMTRSKLKEVVEKGVVIPSWNLSPVKKAREIKLPPQFLDIPLADDDSSDEEYQPDEEEEDETAEESLLESDIESTASSPRVLKCSRSRLTSELPETDEEGASVPETDKDAATSLRHVSAEVVPMGPPPPPPRSKSSHDTAFMEKLHAVDEELASVSTEPFQPMSESIIACRTRSKITLKDVPIGQLEAELCAPDATPDMYDHNTADDEDWKLWLQGLMNDDMENEDEGDDEDDPEYNFLEDLDVPDTEDLRNDRAVRITKKEVNELMEELFETFQEDPGIHIQNDDELEEDDESSGPEASTIFNTPQAIRFEEPLANMLTQQHMTVKNQLKLMRMKRSAMKFQQEMDGTTLQNEKQSYPLILDVGQKKRLQQQMQQHVQLLTQMHLLCSINPAFSAEAQSASIFLIELSSFATNSLLLRRPFNPDFQTAFQSCNLKDALQLVLDFHTLVPQDWSQCKEQTRSVTKNGTLKCVNDVVCLPKQLAWMMATRKLFMYPELLPICSMRTQKPNDKPVYTKAEDNLLALGLKHFEGTEMPKSLISKYLVVTKTPQQVSVRIKNLSYNRVPDNIIRYYKKTKRLPVLFRCCEDVDPTDAKPPVEREEHRLPFWLKASLTSIQEEMRKLQTVELSDVQGAADSLTTKGTKKQGTELGSDGNKYPLIIPKDLELILKPLRGCFSVGSWRQKSSLLKPILMKPNLSSHAISSVTAMQKSLSRPAELLVTNNQDGQIVRTPLTALTSSDKPCQPTPIFRVLLPVAPVPSLPKMALPALTPRCRKSYKRRPRTWKKASPNTTFLIKNFLHSAPLVFTVPSSGFDVLSAGSGCSMVQAVNAPIGQGTQGIPVKMLVDPKTVMMTENQITMPVHVSEYQQFASVVDGLFVKNESSESSLDSNQKTTNLESDNPVFQSSEHRQIFSNMKSPYSTNISIPNHPYMDLPKPPAVDLLTCPVMVSLNSPNAKKLTSLTRESLNSPNAGTPNPPKRPNLNSPKTDLPNSPNSDRLNSSNRDIPNSPDKDIQNPSDMASLNVSTDNCHSPSNQYKTNAEMELLSHVQGPVNVKQECTWDAIEVSVVQVKEESTETIKTEMERDVLKRQSPALQAVLRQDSHGSENDKPFVLTAGQEQCVKSLVQHASKEGAEANTESRTNSEAVDGQVSSSDKKEQDQCPAPTEVGPEQLSTVTSSNDINAGFSRPSGKPDDSTADDQSDTIPAVPDTGKEKDRQEEEEEEDFDDLTQDEEDEEMSSASEESVLSVPELQETMEKLTWLASESHLSQEGESEEENSQEENSEPEEEDEEDAEGEGEGTGDNLHKDEEIVGEVVEDTVETAPSSSPTLKSPPKIQTRKVQQAERAKGTSKGRNSHRTRSQRGRARMSKDTAKLLLLCDENILQRDPLREQKDMAFAQAYLSRVREALLHVPGKYEAFLRIIYEFETRKNEATAVELYSSLQDLLFDYPQLLKDFAAFLLPEQALECGLFEEQQAFDKSRRFLRQLEICFAENPSHHQKIIKVLQGCAECFPEEIEELKTQMGVLLKGHDHLQEEFSLFFDHLRPPASRMGDFEFINWTEEKEYEFDGFEEVMLPDVEEEEDPTKMPPPPRSKRRKDTAGGRNNEKEMDLTEAVGTKECSCSCHEGVGEQRLKKTKRRACSQCNCKVCDGKAVKSKDLQELASANLQTSSEKKDAGNRRACAEELQNEKVESKAPQGQAKTAQGSQTVGTSSTIREELADERPSPANKNGEVSNIRTSSPIELHNSDEIQGGKRLSDAVHTQPAIDSNVGDVPQKPPEPGAPRPSQKSGLALADSSSSEAKGPGVLQGWEKGSNSTVIFPAPIVARELHSSSLVSHTSLDLSRSSLCTGPLVQPVSGVMGVRSFDGISYTGEIPGSISYLCGAQSNADSLHKPSDNSHELSPSLAVPVHPSSLGTVPAPSAIFGTVPVPYATLSGIPVPSGVLSAVLVPSAILGTVPVPSANLSTVSVPPAVLVQGQVPSASLNTAPVPTTALSTVPVFSITSAHPSGPVHSSSIPSGPLPLVTMPVPSAALGTVTVPSAALSTVTVPSAALSTTLVPANTLCTMPVLATALSSTAVKSALKRTDPSATQHTESLCSTTLRTTTGSSATLSTATLGDTAAVSAATGTTPTPAALTKPVPCTSLGASSVNSLTLYKQQGLSLELSSTPVPCVGFGTTSPLSKDASVAAVDRSSTQVPHVADSSTQAPSVTASNSHVPLASLRSTQLASVGVDTADTSPVGIPNIQASPLGLSTTQPPSAGLGSSPALPLFLGSTQMPSVDDTTQVPSVILSSTQVPSVDLSNTPVSPVILSSSQVPSLDLGSIQVDLCSTQVAPTSSSSIVPIATISNLQVPSPGLGPQVLYATISSSQTAPGGVINLKIPSGTFINFQVPPVSLSGSWQAPSNLCSPQKTPSSPSAMPKSSACHSTTQDLAGSPSTQDTQMNIPKPAPDCLDSSDLDSNTCLEAPSSRANCEMDPRTSSDTSPIHSELVSEIDPSSLNEGMQLRREHALKPKESGAELTVCAKNSKVSSTGEKVVLWTREADRVILTTCQEQGAHQETFSAISRQLGQKTPIEISRRFRELMRLFHTSCEVSSEEEEDATSTSNTDQLSDRDLALSEEEQDE